MRCPLILACVLAGFLTSCNKAPQNGLRRIAILPFNILTSKPASEAMRLGGAIALQQDLQSAPSVVPTLVSSESGAYGAGASETALVTVTDAGNHMRASFATTGLSSNKVVQSLVVEGGSCVELANKLAKLIDARAGAFPTSSDAALQAYASSLDAPDRPRKVAALREAIQLDPRFGAAYIALLEFLSDDAPALSETLRAAQAASAAFTPLDRARLAAVTARFGNAALAQQAQAVQAVVNLAPNDVDSVEGLGVIRVLLGDAVNGEGMLRKAVSLAPGRQDLHHQLALGLLSLRRFDAAANELRPLQNEPALQPELAICLLLKGDTAGANQVMDRFFAAQTGPESIGLPLIRANWIALSQGLDKGLDDLSREHFATPDLGLIGASQGVIWGVAQGKPTPSINAIAAALRTTASPAAKAYAIAALATVSGNLESLPLTGPSKDLVLAYTLFLKKQYSQAVEAWAAVLRQSTQTDLRPRAMLAASLDRAGRIAEAGQMRVQPFAPNLVGADPYSAISFAEMRRLLKL